MDLHFIFFLKKIAPPIELGEKREKKERWKKRGGGILFFGANFRGKKCLTSIPLTLPQSFSLYKKKNKLRYIIDFMEADDKHNKLRSSIFELFETLKRNNNLLQIIAKFDEKWVVAMYEQFHFHELYKLDDIKFLDDIIVAANNEKDVTLQVWYHYIGIDGEKHYGIDH
jgi:hypothetical protein